VDLQILQNINERLENFLHTPGEQGDLHSILTHISQTALKLFEADSCFCFAFHLATERLMEQYSTVLNSQQHTSTSHLAPDATLKMLAHYVLRHGNVVVEDVNEHTDEAHRAFMRARSIRSFAAIALRTRHRKRPLAVLYLNFRQKKTFNRRERQNLRQFALLAATLLQEAWLSWRYREISHIGQEINHELSDIPDLFERLRSHIGSIANSSDTLQLVVYHSQTDTWDIYREINGKMSILNDAIPDEVSRYVTLSGQQLFVTHLSKEVKHLPFQFTDHPQRFKEAIVAVPLTLRDFTLGALLLQHHQADMYNKEDLFLLQLLANHIALALHNIRLHSNLIQLDSTGQIITQELDSDEMLQATVNNVRIATMADIVVLFHVDRARGGFRLPPSVSGDLHDPASFLRMSPKRPDDLAELMLKQAEPIFAKQSASLAQTLLADPQVRTGNFEQREEIASTAAIPLQVNNENVGVLFVNFRLPQRFDSPQQLLIEGLGHYIAIAIKNAETFEQLRFRHTRELDILQHIDRELNRMLDLQSILDKILELAKQQVDASIATVILHDSKKREFRIASAIGDDAEQQRTYTIPLHAHSIMRWIMDQKQSVRSSNVYQEAPWRNIYFATKADTISELDVPLLDGDTVVGIINFEHTKEGAFSADDQAFLETLAGQTVLAVKKAQAYENEKRLVQEAQLLNEISKEITGHLRFEHVFGLILEKALQLTRSSYGNFVLYDREVDELRIVAIHGSKEKREGQILSFDRGIVGYVARTQETLNVDPTEEPWRDIFVKWLPDTRSELAIPMLAGNELRGVLNFESPEPNRFDERDVQLVKALADLAVVALQNAERYEKAEKEAERFELLYQVGQELSNVNDVEDGSGVGAELATTTHTQQGEAFTIVHKIIEKRYPDSQVIIRRYDEETQQLILICASPGPISPPTHRHVQRLPYVSTDIPMLRQTQIVYDITAPAHTNLHAMIHDPDIRSMIIVPIWFKEQYYGTIGLCHHKTSHFRTLDAQFIQGLSHQLANTLYRIQANRERQDFKTRATVAEAMSAIGQSAFELTHRLGNDLGLVPTYIAGIQDELEKGSIHNPAISKKLNDIRQAVQTVLTLSKRLKSNLSDMQSRDQLVEEIASVPPAVLFVEAITAVGAIPEEIDVQLETDAETPPVKVIPTLIANILRNLIANAIEAMPNGGILTMRTRAVGSLVMLEVSDTGTGITEHDQKKIFDLFFSTKRSSGFGLWSAKRYALENHGDLTVDSIPGSGSTFTLALPRA
jgi:GAF domain-containing protein